LCILAANFHCRYLHSSLRALLWARSLLSPRIWEGACAWSLWIWTIFGSHGWIGPNVLVSGSDNILIEFSQPHGNAATIEPARCHNRNRRKLRSNIPKPDHDSAACPVCSVSTPVRLVSCGSRKGSVWPVISFTTGREVSLTK
jgi:hypothetical protein